MNWVRAPLAAIVVSMPLTSFAQCVSVETSRDNVVSVVNRCKNSIVARIVDKRGEDLGKTGVIKPNSKFKLSAAPSDFVDISGWCEMRDAIPCKPLAPARR